MKSLSNYIITFTIFVIFLYFITLFLPSEIRVSHKEFIFGETKEVYSVFNDLQQWETWCVWNNQPNKIDIRYHKKTLGEGASFTWQYKKAKASKGIVQITHSELNKEIDFIIKTKLVDTVYSNITFEETPNGVIAEWDIELQLEDSGSRLMGYLLKRWLIRDIKTSMRNINLFLISENKHIGWISDQYEIIDGKETKEFYLIDTVKNVELDSVLYSNFSKFKKIQSDAFNDKQPLYFYRVLNKMDSNTSVIYFASAIRDTTQIPDSLKITNRNNKYVMFKYLGSEIGYKYAIKTALKKIKSDRVNVESNPFIVYKRYPVNISELDTNNTTLSFILR